MKKPANGKRLKQKIAHGQWIVALNRENNAQNPELTQKLAMLDFVEVTKWFEVHNYLGSIVRELVQSPQNEFRALRKASGTREHWPSYP